MLRTGHDESLPRVALAMQVDPLKLAWAPVLQRLVHGLAEPPEHRETGDQHRYTFVRAAAR